MMKVHLIGIGGAGLSGIAQVLLESGAEVSGSDRQASPAIARLEAAGARVSIGHHPENIRDTDIVVCSSAIPADNPEVQAALARGIPVLKRADFLGQLTYGKQTLAVAGTHGKTTTTAMLAWVLTTLGLDPTFIIGGVALNLKTNAHAGQGTFFVIEADEYDRMFLGLNPSVAVIINIEHDHPDCYPTFDDFYQAFIEFSNRVKPAGTILINADDSGAQRLGREAMKFHAVKEFGIKTSASYQASRVVVNSVGGYDFQLDCPAIPASESGSRQVSVRLKIPGVHNVQNALAVMAVADTLGLSLEQCARALSEFRGTGRRFEVRGVAAGITVVDDYAHHPTEIRATLQAGRARFPHQQIWIVWQPHTYSRTRTLAGEFALAFGDEITSPVDHVIVTEIYAAREAVPEDSFTAEMVLSQFKHRDARYIPKLASVSSYLLDHLKTNDVLIVLSAGDADQVSTQVLSGLAEKDRSAQTDMSLPDHYSTN